VAETAQDNAAIIRRGYEAFNGGDLATLREVFAEDAVWHVGGRGRLSGEKRGRDAILGYFGQLGELSGGTFRAELHDVVANDEHVIGLHTASGQREGKSIRVHTALVLHLRAGKISEAWEHAEDTQALDEFVA
jgi:ketosteroid isomerase-like protein